MSLPSLIGPALLAFGQSAVAEAAPPGPPERIVLPVIQPDCDRAGGENVVTVCGRSDRRFRIDSATLTTLRVKAERDSPEGIGRPLAITRGCSEPGPFGCRGEGVIPVGAMAVKAVILAVKALKGEDLRPALRQGPTEYEVYEEAKAEWPRRMRIKPGGPLLERRLANRGAGLFRAGVRKIRASGSVSGW